MIGTPTDQDEQKESTYHSIEKIGSKAVGFDFDGALARFPAGVAPNFDSPIHSFLYANASLPIISLAKSFQVDGY
jgi:hypothetical protein